MVDLVPLHAAPLLEIPLYQGKGGSECDFAPHPRFRGSRLSRPCGSTAPVWWAEISSRSQVCVSAKRDNRPDVGSTNWFLILLPAKARLVWIGHVEYRLCPPAMTTGKPTLMLTLQRHYAGSKAAIPQPGLAIPGSLACRWNGTDFFIVVRRT